MANKVLYWTPRLLGILAICFVVLFSLDCFEGKFSLKEQLTCFLMHNIPAFILVFILIIAWKMEFAGGLLFLVISLGIAITFMIKNNYYGLLVLVPFMVTGALFLVHHYMNQKKDGSES